MGTAFRPGLELAAQFYADVIRPSLDRLYPALHGAIQDPAIRALPMAGAVDQFIDSTDALADAAALRAAVAALLRAGSATAR